MKRVLLICLFTIMLLPITNVKASCGIDESYKLNIIGSNIQYYYEYVKSNTIFNVKFYNVRKEVYLEYKDKIYNPNNSEVNFKNVDGSQDNIVNVYASSNTHCKGEFITAIPIELPTYNSYYKSDECSENRYHKYCAKYLDSGIDITKVQAALNEEDDEEEDDVANYLKQRKNEKVTVKIKTTVKDIFTKRNMILMVLIVLLVLVIVALIKKLREIVKLKF